MKFAMNFDVSQLRRFKPVVTCFGPSVSLMSLFDEPWPLFSKWLDNSRLAR
jgi:hypothetical protein